MDTVITSPQHPYPQLLIDSIPWPDLTRKWGQQEIVASDEQKASGGCKFASRCPFVMDKCRQAAPPLFHLDQQRVAACYLYEDKAQVPGEALGSLFAERTMPTTA